MMSNYYEGIRAFVANVWEKVPNDWRPRIVVGVIVLVLSQLIRIIWGDGVWISVLIVVGIIGALLSFMGVREGKYADQMLGKVWDYFRSVIVFAIIPGAWPAIQSIFRGNLTDGLIQLAVFGVVIAAVFEQFSKLPRTMSTYMFKRRRR